MVFTRRVGRGQGRAMACTTTDNACLMKSSGDKSGTSLSKLLPRGKRTRRAKEGNFPSQKYQHSNMMLTPEKVCHKQERLSCPPKILTFVSDPIWCVLCNNPTHRSSEPHSEICNNTCSRNSHQCCNQGK